MKKRTGFLLLLVLGLISVGFLTPSNSSKISYPSLDYLKENSEYNPIALGVNNPNNITELQLFFDDIFEKQLADYPLPGVTLSVVNATNILYLKGYGYANVEESKPVSPNTTMFRAASISKLFVWTAVMQLVEQGLLDLNTDVNEYLITFKIPDKYDTPITLTHLMGHSAGFEEIEQRSGKVNKVDLLPFEEYMTDYMPKRVFPPGEISAYSNYGASLAGYIVSQVSNKSFDEYVEDNIFSPLGMNHSTFRQPIPTEYVDDLATGYHLDADAILQAQLFEYINLYPAGSLSLSALDAAYFMMAHLNNGSLSSNQILEEVTAQQMHLQHFTHHPDFDGFAHGFFEYTINDHRIIWHGGDLEHSHSALLLVLDQNIGFFFNYNSGQVRVRMNVINDFMDHFYPTSPPTVLTPSVDFKERGKKYTGNYYSSRRELSSPLKTSIILSFNKIDLSDEGYLLAGGLRFVEIEDNVFREQNGTMKMAFRENSRGKIIYMFLSYSPSNAFIKQLGAENAAISWGLAFTGVALLLYTLFYPFVDWIIRKRRKQEKPQRTKNERFARKFLITTSGGYVLHLAIFGGLMGTLFVSDTALPVLKVLQVVPFLLLIPLGFLIVYTVLLWKDKQGSLILSINAVLSVVTTGFLLWWMSIWNWLGFTFF